VTDEWRPTCTIESLQQRSRALGAVRAFFAARDVLEVDTPVLSRTTVTDAAIESMSIDIAGQPHYLQTSPEYHMKRLLAAGAPSIVRIGPVFRAEEMGRLHNPEFTMIEWYRRDFDLAALMAEVRELVDLLLGPAPFRRVTYFQLLFDAAGIDPWRSSIDELNAALGRLGIELSPHADASRRDLLDLLAAYAMDRLGAGRVFVTDYPADQAALARVVVGDRGREVAQRFELVIDGVEIANGYDELADAAVLAERMQSDRARRLTEGREQPAPDQRLLDAMRHGLPACSGVALGFDRLLLLRLGLTRIDEVLPFSFSRC
jgi:elongation factor P--(R)-beta-lysine ligase